MPVINVNQYIPLNNKAICAANLLADLSLSLSSSCNENHNKSKLTLVFFVCLFFLITFILEGVAGRMLEPIAAAYGRGRVHPSMSRQFIAEP